MSEKLVGQGPDGIVVAVSPSVFAKFSLINTSNSTPRRVARNRDAVPVRSGHACRALSLYSATASEAGLSLSKILISM